MPKGVMLTHKNLVSNCQSVGVPMPYEPLVLPTTSDYQEILPCFVPFYHIYGLMVVLIPKLAVGAKIVSMPKFEVNHFLRIVKEHKATFLHLVPPSVITLNNRNINAEYFERVRLVMCTASSLAQSDAERFRKMYVPKKSQYFLTIYFFLFYFIFSAPNASLIQGYGLTETSPITTITPRGLYNNYSTIGWPVPNVEVKIASVDDPLFKGLNANETGELLVRGPNIMRGYYKNDQATRATITETNWLRTGDIGHFDENGLFYVSDRIKELIKVNAFQVAPAELEAILRKHNDLLDAAVVGISHPKYGEVPKAFVIRKSESQVTEKDIQAFVAKQVIKYKQLRGGVQFVDSIPKTSTGKILRREIRQKYS